MAAGRPSKRTPEREQRLLQAVRAGNTLRASCAFAGLTEDTVARWRTRYADFAESLTRALAESEVNLVALIRVAAGDDWRASAWLLERRWPDTWSKTQRVELELRAQAEHLAAELGLDASELIQEAQRIATAYQRRTDSP